MSANHTSAQRSGTACHAATNAALISPTDHAPLWRSVAALADSLNEGSKRTTFTHHSIRHYIRFAAANGLAPHIRRLGSKILIDEIGFRDWINRQGQEA